MYKLVLSVLIVLCATFLGNSFALKLSMRRKTLNMIVSAISRMKTLICFGSFEIIRVVNQCFYSEEFDLLCINNLDSDTSYSEAFSQQVRNISKKFALNDADKELLVSFGSELGTTDIGGQVAHAELYQNLFLERLSEAKEQETVKSRLYKVLGFSLGCAVSLIIA